MNKNPKIISLILWPVFLFGEITENSENKADGSVILDYKSYRFSYIVTKNRNMKKTLNPSEFILTVSENGEYILKYRSDKGFITGFKPNWFKARYIKNKLIPEILQNLDN